MLHCFCKYSYFEIVREKMEEIELNKKNTRTIFSNIVSIAVN